MRSRIKSRPRFRPPLASAALLMFLGACANLDYALAPEPKAPRADLTQFSHDVRFDAGMPRLTGAARRRIDAFFDTLNLRSGDRVLVLAGSGARSVLAERRQRNVDAYLRLKGAAIRPLASDFGASRPEDGLVRILVRRYIVTLPGCPDWTKSPGSNFANTVHSNFGCATAINLGLMVAEPGDLVRGRRLGPADGEAAALAIDRYRRGETKALTPEDLTVIENQAKSDAGSSGGGQ